MKKEICLNVGSEEINFEMDTAGYNLYLNELQQNSKVTPMVNLLKRSVSKSKNTPEAATRLQELIDAGYHVEIAAELLAAFKPDLEISAKK